MHLENSEPITVTVPPGTAKAIAEVAARRDVPADDYLRHVILSELQKRTGFTPRQRALETAREVGR